MKDINTILETYPALMAKAGEDAENLREGWQKESEVYAHEEARFVLTLKATSPTIKATEIKYFVNNDPALYDKRLALVVAEAAYRKKEVEMKGLEEELRSVKWLAKMRIAEFEGQLSTNFKGKE